VVYQAGLCEAAGAVVSDAAAEEKEGEMSAAMTVWLIVTLHPVVLALFMWPMIYAKPPEW
jgi:hypothetical protein